MKKTNEELNEIKKEYDELVNELKELTEEEIDEIAGGCYQKEIGKDKNAKVIYQ